MPEEPVKEEAHPAHGADNAGRVLEVVRALAAEVQTQRRPPADLTLDTHLDRELGFDSLMRVEIIARL